MLVDAIRLQNEKSHISNRINLKGFMVGNGCIGSKVGVCAGGAIANHYRLEFMYGHGLISDSVHAGLLAACGSGYYGTSVACHAEVKMALRKAGRLNIYDIYRPCRRKAVDEDVVFPVPLREDSVILEAGLEGCLDGSVASVYLNSPAVRQALHAKSEADIGKWKACKSLGYQPTVPSLLPIYPTLIRTYRTLIYNGNVDACVPYTDNEDWTSGLGLPVKESWRPWTVDDQVAGYATTYDVNRFTFLTVQDSGHMVPQYEPVRAYAMFERFINDKKF